jgi:hypothetical protein
MLCVALLFVFGQAAVASTVGSVQHAIVGHHDHQHMMFADISLDAAQHDADDDDHDHGSGQLHDEGAPAEHGPAHHHHHGDLGAASLLAASPSGLTLAWSGAIIPVPGRLLTDTRHSLPDRPPRTALLHS